MVHNCSKAASSTATKATSRTPVRRNAGEGGRRGGSAVGNPLSPVGNALRHFMMPGKTGKKGFARCKASNGLSLFLFVDRKGRRRNGKDVGTSTIISAEPVCIWLYRSSLYCIVVSILLALLAARCENGGFDLSPYARKSDFFVAERYEFESACVGCQCVAACEVKTGGCVALLLGVTASERSGGPSGDLFCERLAVVA